MRRMTGKRVRVVILLIVLNLLILGGVFWVFPMHTETPYEALKRARTSLSSARIHKANIYAPEKYLAATQYYDSSMQSWIEQNKKFVVRRNYAYPISLAIKAEEASKKSIEQARMVKLKVRNNLLYEFDSVAENIQIFRENYNAVPLPEEIAINMANGRFLLKEAKIAFNQGNYIECQKTLSESLKYVELSNKMARQYLENYFLHLPDWKQWEKTTIESSRKSPFVALLIDKFARKCYVYQKGLKNFEFDVELSENWIGDKKYQGDNATPEGLYHVLQRKESNQTKYHKALLLNYPSEEDRRELAGLIGNGNLPPSTHIGGLIEIHGKGGQGSDWTNGCIALENNSMDVLFRHTPVGTPVTIVGSLQPLSEILAD